MKNFGDCENVYIVIHHPEDCASGMKFTRPFEREINEVHKEFSTIYGMSEGAFGEKHWKQ